VLVTDEGTALASEPWDDDPRWRDLPDRTLVEVGPDGVRTTPLTETPEVP
jgi:glutamine amidotransferase